MPEVLYCTSLNLYFYCLLFPIHILNPSVHFFKDCKTLVLDSVSHGCSIPGVWRSDSTGCYCYLLAGLVLFPHGFQDCFLWHITSGHPGQGLRCRWIPLQKGTPSPRAVLSKFLAWDFSDHMGSIILGTDFHENELVITIFPLFTQCQCWNR